jgi:hypothetical protein
MSCWNRKAFPSALSDDKLLNYVIQGIKVTHFMSRSKGLTSNGIPSKRRRTIPRYILLTNHRG